MVANAVDSLSSLRITGDSLSMFLNVASFRKSSAGMS